MRSGTSSASHRARAHATAAVILSDLWLLSRDPEASTNELKQHVDGIIQAAHNLRLEDEHSGLAQALMALNGELYGIPAVVPGNEAARQELLQITGMPSGAVVVWFQAEDVTTRQAALRSIRRSQEATKKMLQAQG